MSTVTEIKRLTSEELLEKRRSTLISRIRAARLQLDSLSLLDTSYDTCRQTLRQWRSQMLDEINKAHETSLTQLKDAYEQINHFRSNINNLMNEHNSNDQQKSASIPLKNIKTNLNALGQTEFTFDFDHAGKLEGELQLLKLFHPQQKSRSFDKSNTTCRLLVPCDRYVSDVFFYDDLITRIDCKAPECILICPFDLLGDLLGNDQEVRILIDQTYLSSIDAQAQRIRTNYGLILLHLAQECCPQSTERVIKILCKDARKMLSCLEEIYTICSQQVAPMVHNPYTPVNYDRSRTHLYDGYSDILNENCSKMNNETTKTNRLYSQPINNSLQTPTIFTTSSLSSSLSSQQHFDRVLMPVSIHRTLSITDVQAGALLGPKGERIQQLQRETGAIVNIGDIPDDNSERRKRVVNIQGNQQQVTNALQAIKTLLMIVDDGDDVIEGSFKRYGEKLKRM